MDIIIGANHLLVYSLIRPMKAVEKELRAELTRKGTSAKEALGLAESLRQATRETFLECLDAWKASPGMRAVTVPVGVARTGQGAGDKDSLLRRVDNALYRAKEGGTNRVRSS